MRIKSLELIGFKSFYYKTPIYFHNGITAVVGPNGCGKSNILDAIRWVLGEQNPRRLRAGLMEDLISNGSELLKPLGMAEVSAIVSGMPGQDFDEVEITRRFYRSGESEYYINGVSCRLKDIAEMFLDTGAGARAYSVIGQGRIQHLITAKPEEKRNLVEEVAGVLKYKARRTETEKRIEATRENLVRLEDVAAEVRRQMKGLARQVEQARKFKELSERANRLELSILSSRLSQLKNERKKLSIEKEEIELKATGIKNEIGQIDSNFENSENELSSLEQNLEGWGEEIHQILSELQAEESFRELINNKVSNIDSLVARLNREAESLKVEAKNIEKQIFVKKETLKEVSTELSAHNSELEQLESKLYDIESSGEGLRAELEAARSNLLKNLDQQRSLKTSAFGCDKELQELAVRKSRIQKELEETEREIKDVLSKIKDLDSILEENQNRHANIENRKGDLSSSISSLIEEKESMRELKSSLDKQLAEQSSRLNALREIEQNYEWLPEGVREFLLEKKGNGVLGVVSDFTSVPRGLERALEAALGDKMKWVIVTRRQEALSAFQSLRKLSLGRATFIWAENMRNTCDFVPNEGDITPLSKIVEVEGIDRAVVENMIHGAFLVSSIEEALSIGDEIRNGTSFFVTPDGDLFHSSGAVSGGTPTEGVFIRKRQIGELTNSISEIQDKLSLITGQMQTNREKIQLFNNELERLEKVLRQSSLEQAETMKDISNLEENLRRAERRHEVVKFDLQTVNSEINEKKEQRDNLQTQLTRLEEEKTSRETEFNRVETKVEDSKQERESLESKISEVKIAVASLSEKEKNLKEDLNELDRRKRQLAERLELGDNEIKEKKEEKSALIQKARDSKEETEKLLTLLQEREKDLSAARVKRNALLEQIKETRHSRERMSEELSELREKASSIDVRLNSLQIEIEHNHTGILDIEKEASRITDFKSSNHKPDDPKQLNLETAESELKDLKEKLDKYGPVNLLAPEEYKNLEERSNFLNDQMDDLRTALLSLKRAISKIDEESKKRFKEAFEAIDEKFKEVFTRLFRGGEAKLVLTEPDDLLETGIEVMVRPRGKKFHPVNLLSGGEKALSGIALVVAACLVKPVPFLLFDEIDAPLDETNTSYFTDLLPEIAEDSQVVIITHNKRTMQAVDTLIGITSDKSGTSKVVSVELTDDIIQSYAADKTEEESTHAG